MPLYEYQCDACGSRFERIQKFSDPLVTVCPTCGGAVRKLLSSPAIQFKGSGFYITDYAKAGPGSEGSKSDKSEKKSGDATTSSSSDTSDSTSKPAAPTESKSDSKSTESSKKSEPSKT